MNWFPCFSNVSIRNKNLFSRLSLCYLLGSNKLLAQLSDCSFDFRQIHFFIQAQLTSWLLHFEQCESLSCHFSSAGFLRAQLCMQGQSISIWNVYSKDDMLDILRGSLLHHLATFVDLVEKDLLFPPFLSYHLWFEIKNNNKMNNKPNKFCIITVQLPRRGIPTGHKIFNATRDFIS